jgi:hypothetical protein
MLELIAAAAAAGVGYVRSRSFVARRMRFVDAVQRPAAPLIAGAAAMALAVPVVWVLPIIGGGTALIFGIAVAAGTSAGARNIRRSLLPG